MAGRPKAITSLQETPTKGKRNWLIYADSGKGKTVLAGTAENALFLTVEAAGTESARAFGSTADEWVTESWDEIQEAYAWLKNGGSEDYDTVVLDSLSEMEQACWKAQLEEAHALNSNRSLYQPALQDYQIIGNKMKRMVEAFNRLPVNIIYTAQAMRLGREDEDGEDATLLLPLVGSTNNGVLSQRICGDVTLVGYLSVQRGKTKEEEPYRRLWTAATERMFAKDRHDAFGRYLDSPSIPEMFEAVEKRIAEGGRSPATSTAPAESKIRRAARPQEADDDESEED